MSEADIPNNSASPEAVSPMNLTEADRANPAASDSLDGHVPGNVPVSEEIRQSLDFPAFSSWVEAVETRTSPALPAAQTSSWVEAAETETLPALSAAPTSAPSELAEMVALNQELQVANSNLLKRIAQLDQTVAESQKTLQWHRKRLQAQEVMLGEKHKELVESQEQAQYLFHELEAAHQTAQRQQILIETLTDQLESSQERVAQLERECALTQASYNQQSYQLVETENTCRELRNRLSRQQRHTLQFKVALEKCLEVPIPNYEVQADTVPSDVTRSVGGSSMPDSSSRLSKAQPIPPWSAQSESLSEEAAWDSLLSSTSNGVWGESTVPTASAEVDVSFNVPTTAKSMTMPENDNLTPTIAAETTVQPWPYPTCGQQFSQVVSTPKETFEEQLDTLMNLLFQQESFTPVTEPLPRTISAPQSLDEDMSESEEAHWRSPHPLSVEETARALPDSAIASSPASTSSDRLEENYPVERLYKSDNAPETLYTSTSEEPDSGGSIPPSNRDRGMPLLPMAELAGIYQGDSMQLPPPETSSPVSTDPHTSPSPVVYPLRPPKGRKSLAAVELPTFS